MRLVRILLSSGLFAAVATAAPLITSQPQPQTVVAGEHALLTVAATGGAMTYQWFRGTAPDTASPVAGADGPLLLSHRLRQGTSYWVRISDASGSSDSETCAVAVTAAPAGVLKGMGSSSSGQLGGEVLERPVPAPIAEGVVQASILASHSLFVKNDGTLWGLGDNWFGELGDGTTTGKKIAPVQVAANVVQAAAGENHSLFLKADGTAWSMGANHEGQLCRTTSGNSSSVPGQLASDVVEVAVGSDYSFFLKADGSLWAAGVNGSGQLGNGTTTKISPPAQVATGVAAVAAGGSHAMFIKANGSLWGMGVNNYGPLGDGTSNQRTSPVLITTGVREVDAGRFHSAFRKTDGSWWAMGNSFSGQIGDGLTSSRLLPVPLASGIRRVITGGESSLWIMGNAQLWVAGANFDGQLGEVGTNYPQPTLTAAATPYQAVQAEVGATGTLFIDASPQIAVQPLSQGVLPGGSVQLSIQANGIGPFAYQWFRGESGNTAEPVASAEAAALNVSAPVAEARYWVRVSNPHGSTDSSTVVLELATAPQVSGGLEPRVIRWGEGTAVTMQASGGALSYQWFAGISGDATAPVAGATGPYLLTPPLFGGASYWVRISNAAGSLDSPAVQITPGASLAGSLRGSGQNSEGVLGTGDGMLRASPTSIDAPVIGIAAAFNETRYIRPDFAVWETQQSSTTPKRAIGISAVKVVCGAGHEFYLQADGALWAKGGNDYGQLGDGTITTRSTPVQVATGVADVAAGSSHTLILKADGGLWACGLNTAGQLGDGTFDSRPTPVLVATGVRTIAANQRVSHFIKNDGSLWSMGRNDYGQLGTGTSLDQRRPVQVASGVVRVAAGDNYCLFVKNDGGLWAMGGNTYGQTGPVMESNAVPKLVASGVSRIAAGSQYSLYETTDGTLWGLGSNVSGQFGNGATSFGGGTPVAITSNVNFFAVGSNHSLFVDFKPGITGQPTAATVAVGATANLSVTAYSPAGALGYQWFAGQAGDTSQPVNGGTDASLVTPPMTANTNYWVRITNDAGSADSRAVLVTVVTPPVITTQPQPATINSGDSAVLTVAVSGLGLSYQWFAGAVGDTSMPVSGATGALLVSPPLVAGGQFWVRVTNIAGATDSAAAAIALTPEYPGALLAAGANASGQLGDGTTTQALNAVEIANSVRDIAGGLAHTLYLATDGTLWVTGANASGQLGDNSITQRSTPVPVATDVVRATAGNNHSLILKRDGTLWGIGRNDRGQLGRLVMPISSWPITRVPGFVLAGVAQVAAGGNHTLVVRTDGSLWSMGDGTYGQLGSGGNSSATGSPRFVTQGVIRIAAGANHSLFLKADGSLWAMGLNTSGQLGDGTTTNRSTPVQVATGVATVAAGSNFSLHLTTAGMVRGTGASTYGQLGTTGTISSWNSFALAARAIAAGAEHTLILKTDGALQVLGRNQAGQLGTGNTTNRSLPVQVSTGVTRIAAGGTHSLFLRAKPVILSQPQEVGAVTSQTPLLAVTATGYPALTYQWYAGTTGVTSQPLAGATATTFTAPAFTGDANYWVRVTGPGGSADSQTIVVKAVTVPAIAVQPSAAKIAQGNTAALEVSATGGALSFQWYAGLPGDTSSPVPGGTLAKLETLPLGSSSVFWVRVTNAAGSVDSAAATVTTVPAVLAGLGWNAVGQLGDGTVTDVLLPQHIADDVISVAGGNSHVMLLKSDGTLWAAGNNGFGTLGDGTTTDRPTFVQIASGVVKIDAGYLFSLFLKSDGTLWGSGLSSSGALGIPENDRFYTPVQIASNVTDLAAGRDHCLFVKEDGTLWGTGQNFWGQLGDGTEIDKDSPVQITTGVAKVAAGSNHSHFIKTDGTLWGMGYNYHGNLGDGTTDERQTPVQIATGVSAVSDGDEHSLFVKTDGTLWATGNNARGRLGDGTTDHRKTPVQIASGVRGASAGYDHSLFVTTDNTLWAAGYNRNGQLGDGTQISRSQPVQVASGVSVAVAADDFSLFCKGDGSAWAMGANTTSHFGDDLDFLHDQPWEFDGPVSQFAAGSSHSLFAKPDGSLWATGYNISGQLGDGTALNRFEPIQVATGVRQVAAGWGHSLFLKTDGVLWGLGSNIHGELGDGSTMSYLGPIPIASGVREVVAGFWQSAFIRHDGTLWRMGQDLTTPFSGDAVSWPTFIASGVTRAVCGERHLLFLKTDGSLWAVGQNNHGQLGTGNTTTQTAPVMIATGIIDVAAGRGHSLYVKADGSLWAMGSNFYGELGVQTEVDWEVPVPVRVASGVSRVWGGDAHSVFLKSDGSLWGMGYAANGALGDARDFDKRVPAKIASGVISASAGGGHTLFLAIGPVISSQPQSVTVDPGVTAHFSVVAFGPGTLDYQWFRGVSGDVSQPVAGADGAGFSPPPASAPQNYWVRVSNEHAHADSRTVVVAIAGSGDPDYQSWAVARGLSDFSGDADPDQDGSVNIIEYAFNTDPLVSTAGQLPTVVVLEDSSGSDLGITFRFLKHAAVTWEVERSDNLETWFPVDDELGYYLIDPDVEDDGTTELRRVVIPNGASGTKGYLRLNILPE